MTRIGLLRALLPASLGLALLQATLGWPLTVQNANIVRLVAFLVWFAAVLGSLMAGQRTPQGRRVRPLEWMLLVGTLLLLVAAIATLGWLGAPVQAQVALGVAVLGALIWRLGESWISAVMANAGILVIGCGLSGLLLAFTPLRSWTGLVSGMLGGGMLLCQGLWSALRRR